jgi:hypothetical protein
MGEIISVSPNAHFKGTRQFSAVIYEYSIQGLVIDMLFRLSLGESKKICLIMIEVKCTFQTKFAMQHSDPLVLIPKVLKLHQNTDLNSCGHSAIWT